MTKLMPVAQTIKGDEKAVGLTETNYKTPDQKAIHRYQCIYVVRDGQTAEFRRDLGDAKNFKGVYPMNIPSLLEHTVDELLDLANELRGQAKIDVKDLLGLDKFNPA
jgi:hypothetical protein